MAYTGKKPTDHTDVTQSQSMTVTDDLTVDTNTLKVDSTNNRVGIGTTSPASKVHIQTASSGATVGGGGDELIVENSLTAGLSILSGASNDGNILFGDSGNSAAGYVQYKHGDDALAFGTVASERMRIDSSGNVGIGESSPSNPLEVIGNVRIKSAAGDTQGLNISSDGNGDAFIDGGYSVSDLRFGTNGTERMRIQSGGGISFNGDTAAANALNDYEEGAWTPNLNGFTGSFTHQRGRYIKIGAMVYASFHLDVSATGGSGNLILTNLPFTAANSSNDYGGVTTMHCNNWASTTKPDNGLVFPNATTASFYKAQGAVGTSVPTIANLGTGNFLGVLVYEST